MRHDIVAVQRGDGDEGQVVDVELGRELGELGADLVEAGLVEVHEVHLVDAQDQVLHLEEGRDHRVASRLLQDAFAGVDEDERHVGGGGAGHHVAGVLRVAGGVGDDELAARGREVPVGDVDGDALLAFRAEAISEQGEGGVVEAPVAAGSLDRFELILEDLLGLQEQTPDEGALAVVDGPSSREAEQLHQKYPSRLRSSMPASEMRSSARVAPRSVTRDAATSAITSSTVAAADSTAPVQVASPTVRNRTRSSSGLSPSREPRYGVTARSMPSRPITGRRCA